MAIRRRVGLILWSVVAVSGTALTLGCGRERPGGGPVPATPAAGRVPTAAGKAPPIPPAGSLARPRSLQQVGLPAELTRQATPPDNPQTPEKVPRHCALRLQGTVINRLRPSLHCPSIEGLARGLSRTERNLELPEENRHWP